MRFGAAYFVWCGYMSQKILMKPECAGIRWVLLIAAIDRVEVLVTLRTTELLGPLESRELRTSVDD